VVALVPSNPVREVPGADTSAAQAGSKHKQASKHLLRAAASAAACRAQQKPWKVLPTRPADDLAGAWLLGRLIHNLQ
jgi:hypothetical protein